MKTESVIRVEHDVDARSNFVVEGPFPIASGPGLDLPAEWVAINEALVHVSGLPALIDTLQRIQSQVAASA